MLLTPLFVGFAWVLWYCVQAKWSEVIAPNWEWLVLIIVAGTYLVNRLTKGKAKDKKEKITNALALREEPKEEANVYNNRLVATETYVWKTTTRERKVYEESK